MITEMATGYPGYNALIPKSWRPEHDVAAVQMFRTAKGSNQ
jgi:hypothetical protein